MSKVADEELTPAQCRAARALLDWSQGDLERTARVARKTIADFERGVRQPYGRTLEALLKALEAAGIEFTNGEAPGVKLRKARAALSKIDSYGDAMMRIAAECRSREEASREAQALANKIRQDLAEFRHASGQGTGNEMERIQAKLVTLRQMPSSGPYTAEFYEWLEDYLRG